MKTRNTSSLVALALSLTTVIACSTPPTSTDADVVTDTRTDIASDAFDAPDIAPADVPEASVDATDDAMDVSTDSPDDTATDGNCGDLASASHCGTCDHDCHTLALHCVPDSVGCDPSTNPGTTPGQCTCSQCVAGWFDLDHDGSCEYACVPLGTNDATCDGRDDDCDGQTDEDVDLCTSIANCGGCGRTCRTLHGTPACVHSTGATCDPSNTNCAVSACQCVPGDCWWDVDGIAATGCEYRCDTTNGGVEACDGIDNDCNGTVDDVTPGSLGSTCQGGTTGPCADPARAGVPTCTNGRVVCTGTNVITPGTNAETCNNVDDDCNGVVDDHTMGEGTSCTGGPVAPCRDGVMRCTSGTLTCSGALSPSPETCDGIDNDCNGTIDDNLPAAQSGAPCAVPPAPPAGATSACQAGTTACTGGVVVCAGAVRSSSAVDTCGVDANCDGMLTNQPPTMTDVHNCGSCGHDCLTGSVHADWTCSSGTCQFVGCQPGYYDLNGDERCEYPCTRTSAQEICNNLDDNCDGQIDETSALVVPTPVEVCGVSPTATRAECSAAQVTVACTSGAWRCTFPAGVCNPTCAAASEVCDTVDNNCNGLLNENVPNFGAPCASDDANPLPGDGACRTTGTYVCNGLNASRCSAVRDTSRAGPELCDGVDNDCDGAIDEPFTSKGANATYFVRPAVTQIGTNLWIYQFEASRPNATNAVPGSGNGYTCTGATCAAGIPSAPAGVTLDRTRACSVQGRIPWFRVTPAEAEQTCSAMGGRLCTAADWQSACTTAPASATTCTWGYAPLGAACTLSYTSTRFCNLGPSYDFDASATGDQDGLLVTGSSALQNCYADWTTLFANPTSGTGQLYDVTGNLREIVRAGANTYPLMGGAFDTAVESGATCGNASFVVDQSFAANDTGFRCCFTSDPRL